MQAVLRCELAAELIDEPPFQSKFSNAFVALPERFQDSAPCSVTTELMHLPFCKSHMYHYSVRRPVKPFGILKKLLSNLA